MSRGDLRRSWADVGAQEAPKWAPRRVKKGGKLSRVKLSEVEASLGSEKKNEGIQCQFATRPAEEVRGDQEAPKTAARGCKMLQDDPKGRPRSAQDN